MNRYFAGWVVALVVAGGIFFQCMPRTVTAAQQNSMAGTETSPPVKARATADPGAASYARNCAICHGVEREGILPGFPPLTGIEHRMNGTQIAEIVHTGKGRMPGFPAIESAELNALVGYLTAGPASAKSEEGSGKSTGLAEAGGELFHQNCAFCHGRDAMGGESGPDLTQSKIVVDDPSGAKIAEVVRDGRPDNKMPGFNFSSQELASLVAFLQARVAAAAAHPGGRRGVVVADLQTGNAAAGKAYFEGAGGCAKCHSATGDLAGIARKFQGLALEEWMLYPRGVRSTLTVTTATGEQFTGTLAYRDEFTVALRDSEGVYKSWPTRLVKFAVNSPVEAHVEQFPKYSDDDVHNLMAYLQTLK